MPTLPSSAHVDATSTPRMGIRRLLSLASTRGDRDTEWGSNRTNPTHRPCTSAGTGSGAGLPSKGLNTLLEPFYSVSLPGKGTTVQQGRPLCPRSQPGWQAAYAHRPLSSSVEAAEGLHGLGAPEAGMAPSWHGGCWEVQGSFQAPASEAQTVHSPLPSHAGLGLVSTGQVGLLASPVPGLHTGNQVQMDEDCCGPRSPLWEEQQPTAPQAHDASQASKVRLQDGVPRAGLRVVGTCSRGRARHAVVAIAGRGHKAGHAALGVRKTSPPPSSEAGNDRQSPCPCKNRTRLKS